MIQRLKNHLKELGQTLSTMTFGEKLEHLWTYYKHVLLIAIAIGFSIWFAVNAVISANQVTLLSGTALNVRITTEGMEQIDGAVTEDGRLEGKTFLDEFPYLDTYYVGQGFLDEQSATYLVTRISAQSLDYILVDQSVLDVISTNYFIDMREIFPAEVLARWPLVYKEDTETGEAIPIGIDITGTAFTEEHVLGAGNLYMTATAGTIHEDAFIRLADFLLQ